VIQQIQKGTRKELELGCGISQLLLIFEQYRNLGEVVVVVSRPLQVFLLELRLPQLFFSFHLLSVFSLPFLLVFELLLCVFHLLVWIVLQEQFGEQVRHLPFRVLVLW